MTTALELLRGQFLDSSERLNARLRGLTDEEFLWEPCAGWWTVRPVGELGIKARGAWQIDYDDDPPDPPPVTTLAWRLLHVASGNWIYYEHAFGQGKRSFLDLELPGEAAAAVEWLAASEAPWHEVLNTLTEGDLDVLRRTNWGDLWPTHRLVTTLIVEQTHHGAEIGVLRDLFREQRFSN